MTRSYYSVEAVEDPPEVDVPQVDVPLVRKLWDWIQLQWQLCCEGYPNEWEQGSWVSVYFDTTKYNFDPVVQTSDVLNRALPAEQLAHCQTTACAAGWVALTDPEVVFKSDDAVLYNGKLWSIESFAQMRLGITDDEANCLFNGDNGIDDMEHWLTYIMNRAGDTL